MGKKSPSPPPAPDPAATAQAQAAANKEAVYESARVNQFNQVTPYGTLTYTGDIGSPDRTATTTLNPTAQTAFDDQQRLAAALSAFGVNNVFPQVSGAFSQPLTFGGLQPLPVSGGFTTNAGGFTPIDTDFALHGGGFAPLNASPDLPTRPDLNAAAQAVEQATFERTANLLNPQFEQQERRLTTDLANRGIPVGSDAFNSAFDQFNTTRNNALENAALSSVAAGRAEQSRLANLAQQLRQQQINEVLTLRTQPINELAALMQGAPALATPQFGAPAQYQIAPPDILGAQQMNLAQQNLAYNAAMDSRRGAQSGLYSLGAAAIGAIPWSRWCWVARAVYGPRDPRWLEFREWMLNYAPAWLRSFYRRYGPAIAKWVDRHPWSKRVLRPLMDVARRHLRKVRNGYQTI